MTKFLIISQKNSGVFTPIKSKTVSLTISNYKRWTSGHKETFFLIQKLDSLKKVMIFGLSKSTKTVTPCVFPSQILGILSQRATEALLNSDVSMLFPRTICWIDFLIRSPFSPLSWPLSPVNIPIFSLGVATVLTLVTNDSLRKELKVYFWIALKRFIDQNIINFINQITEKSYKEKFGSQAQERFSSSTRKSDVIYLTTGDTTPIFYKYAAFQVFWGFLKGLIINLVTWNLRFLPNSFWWSYQGKENFLWKKNLKVISIDS